MAEPTDSSPKRLEIKKYPNRRYYDATHSRHLTLEEIRTLIQQGYDIRVMDARTSADITGQVLTQLILELDTAKLDSLPVPLLVRLIRMNDQLVKDFIDKYFNQALKSFLGYQQQVEEQIRKAHGLPQVIPSVSAWTKAMFAPFASAFENVPAEPPTPTTADAPQRTEAPGPSPASSGGEVTEMIRDLQRQVAELKKKRQPRKKRR
jgi:polyhydroxyalkanoate synthesis repressor PhaR